MICISGLIAAILNSGNQPTSGNVGSVMDETGMVANVGVAVGSGSQAQSVQMLYPVSVAAILISGSRSTSGNVGRRRAVSAVAYPSRARPKYGGRS